MITIKKWTIFLWLALYGSLAMGFEIIGVGGFEHKPPNESSYIPVTTIVKDSNLTSVNTISLWITKDWKQEWYPVKEVNKLIVEKGYTPMFIIYWFADDISVEFIQKNYHAYIEYLKSFREYLDGIKGKTYVVLHPEYNENGVGEWDGFNDLLLESKKILNNGNVRIGPCVGDFGNYDKASDKENWSRFHPSLKRSIEEFDFIAFQEMRGLTRNKPNDIKMIPERIEAFSTFLKKKYNKPVLLSYLAISSWGENAEALQADAIKGIAETQNTLERSGLFGINLFHLIDFPDHIGYFNEGEKHFGIIRADMTPKPSFEYFKHMHLKKVLKLKKKGL